MRADEDGNQTFNMNYALIKNVMADGFNPENRNFKEVDEFEYIRDGRQELIREENYERVRAGDVFNLESGRDGRGLLDYA